MISIRSAILRGVPFSWCGHNSKGNPRGHPGLCACRLAVLGIRMPQYDRKTTFLSDNDINMSLPVNIDEYSRLVVLDDNELQARNVAVSVQERLR